MGQIVKQVAEGTTRYYWYPGDRRDWIRAGVAAGGGLVAGGVLMWSVRDAVVAVTVGSSVTAVIAGLNLGRRDYRAAHGFPELTGRAARRAAVVHGGKAAWRALVEGCFGAAAAVLIANLPARGLLADWVLPIVPATSGALAHQAGMVYERLAEAGMPEDLPRVPGSRLLTAGTE
jgi:hypothetical protein